MVLIILNHQPYDGTDVTWNALRLAKTLHEKGESVKFFLMNDAVDLARDVTKKPEMYEYDLVEIIKNLYHNGIDLSVCGTCVTRCGIYKNQPYFSDDIKGTMNKLSEWVIEANKVLTF